jgi:hypothetical protein
MPRHNDHLNPEARSDWPPLPTLDTKRSRASAVTCSPPARSRTWTTCTVPLRAFGIDLRIVSDRSDQAWR